jgi:hypothetical protein
MRSRPFLPVVGVSLGLVLACGGGDLTEPESGQIRVTTETTGPLPDPDGYILRVDDGTPTVVGTDATVILTVPRGEHTIELSGLSASCVIAGEARRAVDVPAAQVVEVAYQIACGGTAALTVITSTTGGGPDDGYRVRIDNEPERPIAASATLVVMGLAPGPHTVELVAIPDRCEVETDNPAVVELAGDEAAAVEFRIACASEIETWAPMAIGTNADLTDVWGVSGTDVFTIGERDVPGGIEGLIFHYDGRAWDRQLRASDLRIRAVWGSGASDVYAVGYGFFSTEPSILHYDGFMWAGAPGFETEGAQSAGLESVWGSAPDDVFAVGFVYDAPFERSLIYHFDGTRWERMPVEGSVDPGLSDVWGSSGSDVFAVGGDDFADIATAVILRYDGSAWRVVLEQESVTLNAVWGSGNADVFAAGFQVTERDDQFEVRGVVWHFDGTSWRRMELPEVGVLHEIGGRSPSEVYAVGDEGVVLRYDGARWTRTRPADATLLGVWIAPDGQGFAVGNGGTVIRGE